MPACTVSCAARGGGSSVGRAPGCDPGGRGFKSRPPPCSFLQDLGSASADPRIARTIPEAGNLTVPCDPPFRGLDECVGLDAAPRRRRIRRMRHTRYGYWLEEAGPVEPTEPLAGDTTADVVIVGAGYLGLWTAWQLKALEPGLDVVVLEAGSPGTGRAGGTAASSRRSGTTCRSCATGSATRAPWRSAGRPSGRARDRRLVRGAGRRRLVPRRRHAPGRDERRAGRRLGRASSRPARRSARPTRRRRCRGTRSRARCASPAFLGGGAAARRPRTCSRRGSSLGLRAKVIAAGVRLHERTPVRAARRATRSRRRAGGTRAGRRRRARRQQRHRRLRRLPARARPSPRATW